MSKRKPPNGCNLINRTGTVHKPKIERKNFKILPMPLAMAWKMEIMKLKIVTGAGVGAATGGLTGAATGALAGALVAGAAVTGALVTGATLYDFNCKCGEC